MKPALDEVPLALQPHMHDRFLFEGRSSCVNLPITSHILVSLRKWLCVLYNFAETCSASIAAKTGEGVRVLFCRLRQF
jgi:hypothetical protein